MHMHAVDVPDQYMVLYRSAVEQAAQAGKAIMANVLVVARQSLTERATQLRGLAERAHIELALKLLDSNAQWLNERYPQALTLAFKQAFERAGLEAGNEAEIRQTLHFDQLERMDSDQVHERVALARSQQSAMLSAEAALAELDTYICATLGMKAVQPERNPVRPEIFVRALQSLLAQTHVPSLVQTDWLQHMSSALGKELSVLYQTLSRQLHSEGVSAARYAVVRPQEDVEQKVATSNELAQDRHQTVLTLDRLRRLMVDELDQCPADAGLEPFAAEFSREFEFGGDVATEPDFEVTVSGAPNAVHEMKQVDSMMERIDQRSHVINADPAKVEGFPQPVRKHLRHGAIGLGQALSLEVVTLMVENIAKDVRLLDPIREVVKTLEPALLRLALVDPRFFSDKQHPARQLLQEITHRSMAYDAVDTRGFTSFLEPLQRTIGPLVAMPIENSEPFEQVLKTLIRIWDERKQPHKLEKAVQALQHAEDRNLLAEQIAGEIQARPEAGQVPSGVVDFLCGPWAQVMAHARMAAPASSEDPGQYAMLLEVLLWSAQPELTSKNIAKLTRLVPQLLGKLRAGLNLIDYPSVKTSAFFELLMKLHQQAFKPQTQTTATPSFDVVHLNAMDGTNPWVAPAEAKISGFMDLPDEQAPHPPSTLMSKTESVYDANPVATSVAKPVEISADISLPLGAWVEMLVNGAWMRTQLSWASPHGTLFLFTSAYGRTQSMTKRSRDKLLATGAMRVVSGQPVVDGALDAVAQTAMLNSLDINL